MKKEFEFSLDNGFLGKITNNLDKIALFLLTTLLITISITAFVHYHNNGLSLAYNDARSHLDIGRRVVESLKPGIAQLGSVWLPLPHVLMLPTVWNYFMWQSGLSGSLQSMIAYVATGVIIYLFLKEIGVSLLGRLFGALVFGANLNMIYLQSTAMTEPLLMATMAAGSYYLLIWFKQEKLLPLIKSAFWTMLSTLVRYDGWFLFFVISFVVFVYTWRKHGYKKAEGTLVLFSTLAFFGIFLWFLWNLVIFGDPLYFVFGPFSAHTQQSQLASAGNLPTKGNLLLSLQTYSLSMLYNTYTIVSLLGTIGFLAFIFSKEIPGRLRLAALVLLAPFVFNVLSLFLGHSVIFIQGIHGNSWFNIRYGLLMLPALAIFSGFLVHKLHSIKAVFVGIFLLATLFQFTSIDSVTLDDGRVGASQKNVDEVSGWLRNNAGHQPGFVLISAASHDAIIFSSGLSMKRFIHEGTGDYWESATDAPDRWARWIVMRTHDKNDLTYKHVSEVAGVMDKYNLVGAFPFADIYELKPEYIDQLHTLQANK